MSGTLSHSPAHILRQLLIDLSLASDPDAGGSWPVYYGNEPDKPDNAVTVYGTESRFQGRDMDTGKQNEHHGGQVRVRATDEDTAWAKANAIAVSLDQDVKYEGVTISASAYTVYSVSRRSGPLALGKEPNSRRYLFTINVDLRIRQLS